MPQPPKQIIGLSELKALRRDMAGVSMTPFLDHITKRLKRRIDPRVRVFRNPEALWKTRIFCLWGPIAREPIYGGIVYQMPMEKRQAQSPKE